MDFRDWIPSEELKNVSDREPLAFTEVGCIFSHFVCRFDSSLVLRGLMLLGFQDGLSLSIRVATR